VAGVAGDQRAALFGQACVDPGSGKNIYGSGVVPVTERRGYAAALGTGRLLATVAWGIGERLTYALEASIFATGAAVQWLRDGLGVIEDADETEALASLVPSNEGVYFVPALTGLGAPHWDAYARGAIVGLTRGTTRAHLARATLESMCYQTRDVAEAMQRDSGIRLREIRADGGAVCNRFLMQFQADILGVAVDVPLITGTTGLGAAYLAGLAVGFWESREEIDSKWKLARRYEPRMGEEEREALYRRWLRAVDCTKGWAK
jgi:glycerol kinase